MEPSRWEQLQRREFGTSSALRSRTQGTSGANFRRQAEDYNIATRVLRRQARRGDANSALKLIDVRREANEAGFAPGGIRRKDEMDADVEGRMQTQEQGSADREMAARLLRKQAAEELAPEAAPVTLVPDGIGATVTPESRTTAALDLMEGYKAGDDMQTQRGIDSAAGLGVKDPVSILRGNTDLKYRRTLDRAIGSAKSPAEIASLKARGESMGIKGADFDRRADWWKRKRTL